LQGRQSSLRLWRGVREPYEILSARGGRLLGGRWNPPGVAALYLSFEPATVRAELARAAELQGDREEAIYPLTLGQIAVAAEVVELLEPDLLESLGVETPLSALVPKPQTQLVGATALDLGIEALIVPSVAARAENVVLFPDNLANPPQIVSRRRVSSPGRWPRSRQGR
jgi:RES domain-containing protein